MKRHKLLVAGAIVFVLSVVIGIIGTSYYVQNSFSAMDEPVSAGIAGIGDGLENALLFTGAAVVGSVIGLLLMLAGAIAAYRKSKRGVALDT